MFSIEQRYNICLMAEKHPKWTQLELAKWAYDMFQLDKIPSQGTISRILAKKAIYMNTKEHEKVGSRIRKPNNPLVRKILQEWISQSLWNGIPITSPIIQDTAQSVWHKIPPEQREGNGSFSYKWVSNFLSKMDVNISLLDQQMPKTPKIWTFEERSQLKQILVNIPPENLFTLDETFLAYNLPLDYEQYSESAIQRRIEVATVMLCSNLDGSEKIKPLVVGKYNSYRSFRNYFPEDPLDPTNLSQLGTKMAKKFEISYHSNRKSWLTSNLFHNWLVRWDKRLVANNRKIVIVLDDSCSHRIINLQLKNITLIFTSSNSRFLPFNWGVLDEFKTRYRIQQYQALIKLQRKIEEKIGRKFYISFEQSQLTMSNAFKFIKRAWDSIPSDTIKANWKSSGIIPPFMVDLNENISMAFKKNEILESQLNILCKEFHCIKEWESDMLLDLNMENKNTNFLSTEELIESAIVDDIEPESNYYSGSVLSSTNVSQLALDELLVNSNTINNVNDSNKFYIPNENMSSKVAQLNSNSMTMNNTDSILDVSKTNILNNNVATNDGIDSKNDNNFDLNVFPKDIPTFSPQMPNKIASTELGFSINKENINENNATSLNDELDKLLLEPYNGLNNNENGIINLSTLIDKPNLFLDNKMSMPTLEDINSNNYFKSFFEDLQTNKPLEYNDMSPQPNELPEPTSTFSSRSSVVNSAPSSHTTPNDNIVSSAGTDNIISMTDSNSHVTSSNITAASTSVNIPTNNSKDYSSPTDIDQSVPVIPGSSNYDDQLINSFFKRSSNTALSSASYSGIPLNIVSDRSHYLNNTLQTNIDIAKSLSNVVRYTELNELRLSKSTINELKMTYTSLLKTIKRSRKQLYDNRIKHSTINNIETNSNVDLNSNLTDSTINLNTNQFNNALPHSQPGVDMLPPTNDEPMLDIGMKNKHNFF